MSDKEPRHLLASIGLTSPGQQQGQLNRECQCLKAAQLIDGFFLLLFTVQIDIFKGFREYLDYVIMYLL